MLNDFADQPDPAPVEALLEVLWERGGSDIHITAGSPPLVRVDGRLAPVEGQPVLSPDDTEKLIVRMMGDRLARKFYETKEVDFSFSWGDRARLRANAFTQRGTVALALRLIPFYIPTFEELGLPYIVRNWAELPFGLVLVTGPTGSGKSTTLASVIDYINTNQARHVITIEDPVEYLHRHKRSAVNQREVGLDTNSFTDALRSVLREDPDVLLIGEMRDLESIRAALTVAETGHLVFSTLHTNDTAQAIDRLVDVFPGDQQPQIRLQLANTLAGVLNQQLVNKMGGGRCAAFEVMVGNAPVRNLIREGKTGQIRNVVLTGQKEGMQTIETALSELVLQNVISYETALSHCSHPKEIERPGSTRADAYRKPAHANLGRWQQ
ncbi:MAG: type IV pilus twitching motility protein PilT [Acidimicrobiales bacterium]